LEAVLSSYNALATLSHPQLTRNQANKPTNRPTIRPTATSIDPGTISRREIEATYAITRRIEGEERALDAAALVFTSTRQEIKDQWGLYDG
jgi:hypothetical protein